MTKDALVPTETSAALSVFLSDPEKLRDFPIEIVERMFQLKIQVEDREAKRQFAEAFNRVQAKLVPVKRRGINEGAGGTMFARAEEVMAMLDPIITDEGFSRSISTENAPDGSTDTIRFVLILRHVGGHDERHFLDAPIDNAGPKGSPTKTRLHGTASSYTYCERHLIMKVFGVQTVKDDDGNAAAGLGPSAERISEKQVADLAALREEVAADGKRFLELFGIQSIDELRVSQYKSAVQSLERKRAKS